MKIVFHDGWPFNHPRLFVQDLRARHVNAAGEVCLWRSGAHFSEWLTLAAFVARIEEWVRRTNDKFARADNTLDAHLYFERIHTDAFALVDVGTLKLAAGESGTISASWLNDKSLLQIASGGSGRLPGRWYHVGDAVVPPHSLADVRKLLNEQQMSNFERLCAKASRPSVVIVAWETEVGLEPLVLLVRKIAGEVVAAAIEIAPTDKEVLQIRCGPDRKVLATKVVAVFGVGSVGSNVAVRLAEAGVGELVLVDGERLRPGNVVRHATDARSVGKHKVRGVASLLAARAPWTTVREIPLSSWNPEALGPILSRADLVLETTGIAGFTSMLSLLCQWNERSMLSAALYRGGSIARLRRQAEATDIPICDRTGDASFLTIPAGEEILSFEAGCSAPVNDASPVSVAQVAALTANVAIDTLTSRFTYPEEVVEVYRPLDFAPFERPGPVGMVTRSGCIAPLGSQRRLARVLRSLLAGLIRGRRAESS